MKKLLIICLLFLNLQALAFADNNSNSVITMPIPTIMGEFSQFSNSIRLSGLWVPVDKKFDNIKIVSENMNCD